jgi:hypothetical protein
VPTIKALRTKAETIRAGELEKTLNKLGDGLTNKQKKVGPSWGEEGLVRRGAGVVVPVVGCRVALHWITRGCLLQLGWSMRMLGGAPRLLARLAWLKPASTCARVARTRIHHPARC